MIESMYSDIFVQWASKVGFTLSLKDDEVWVLADLGGEIRFCLHFAHEIYTLTQAQRAESERFVMSGRNITDIERYLTMGFGFSLRSMKKLPFIFLNGRPGPATIEDAALGYQIQQLSPGRISLADSNSIRVVFFGNVPCEVRDAVEFSWIADATLEDLCASYLNPDGLPLFPGCTMRRTHVSVDKTGG